MLGEKGFDLWADGYDESVSLSDEKNEYPFAGYKKIMNDIYNIVMSRPESKILDIGLGTGILAKKLYDNNHEIFGLDFSDKMTETSKVKMPNAHLVKFDFANGLPIQFVNERFDFIVSTYALHHLRDTEKVGFINSLRKSIAEDGLILVGDISFTKDEDRMKCKKDFKSMWDEDEFYFAFDEILNELEYENVEYQQISACAGILKLSNQ